jgi:hypothetical protein
VPARSADHYKLVERSGKLALEPATDSEWHSARVLAATVGRLPGDPLNGAPIQYLGRDFPPSGPYWWHAIDGSTRLSEDQAYLALFSYDKKEGSGDAFGDMFNPFHIFSVIFNGIKGTPEGSGHYFFDLFRVADGRRVALIRGRFKKSWESYLIRTSFWLEAGRFGFALSDDLHRFVLCEVK